MFFCAFPVESALHISVYILSINTSYKAEMAKLSSVGAMNTCVLCSILKPSYLAVKKIYQSKINLLTVCLMLPFTTVLFQMLRPNSKHTEINRLERLMLIKIGNQFWIGPLEESYRWKVETCFFLISERHTLFCTVFIPQCGTISGFSKMLPLKKVKNCNLKLQYNIEINVLHQNA